MTTNRTIRSPEDVTSLVAFLGDIEMPYSVSVVRGETAAKPLARLRIATETRPVQLPDERIEVMTPKKRYVLEKLCSCEPGKGVPLPREMRRMGNQLIKDGFAMSLGFGSFEVFVATEDGRKALQPT